MQQKRKPFEGKLRYLLPFIVAFILIVTIRWIADHPKPVRMVTQQETPLLQVTAQVIETQTFPITLMSYGRVQGKQQSTLSAEINARVVAIHPDLEAGRQLEAGTLLVQLDDAQIRADLAIAEAQLAQAKALLDEEVAKGKQARKDWQQLHGSRPAPELALRKPQLASAKANVQAAEAGRQKALSHLDQTSIHAPYDCIVLERFVDLGEVASPTTTLATIISNQEREVLLPVSAEESRFLDGADDGVDNSSDNSENNSNKPLRVSLFRTGQPDNPITGWTTGFSGVVEAATQKQYLRAEFINPVNEPDRHLLVGEFVTAEIQGVTIEDAIVIPAETLYEGKFVYIVDPNNTLQKRALTPLWRDEQHVIIATGLSAGEQLVTTPLGKVVSGTRVSIIQPDNRS